MFRFQSLGKWLPFRRPQRNITTTPPKRGGDHHDEGGVPGKNLPFDPSNRRIFAIYMGVYMGSGFATPFLLLRHHLKKKSES